ncbi:MAG TPA: cytochrome c biogenesis protein CcsA [Acidimicrobiales bacterium]|nr:cytochrome c biogenesis protein CcsA [Acidimicrobiales bacterium]
MTSSLATRRAGRATSVLGAAAVSTLGFTVVLGLFVTPPDRVQGDLVRLLYLHPPIAWVMYLAVGVMALASALYLVPRTRSRFWDLTAGASAEIGALFCALTLVTGSIWGRPTWGVWWTWDARLTLTALMLALLLGDLALRRVPSDVTLRSTRSAVAGVLIVVTVPLNHMAVEWWRTLHQPATIVRPDLDPTIDGSMLWTLLLGFFAMTLVYSWLLIHRFRLERLVEEIDDNDLRSALLERRAEGDEVSVG